MKKILFLLIPIFLFACKNDEVVPVDLKSVFIYENIEDQPFAPANGDRFTDPVTGLDYTGWGVYEDIIFPNTEIKWSMDRAVAPSISGASLQCAITGGDKYNNVFFTNTVAMKWEGEPWEYETAKQLVYELNFYIDGTINCTGLNLSTLEGIEFTWQHILIPVSYGFGLQWSKGGEWRYWNDEKDNNGQALGWESFPFPVLTCLEANKWHYLKVIGKIDGDESLYVSMQLNNTTFNLKDTKVKRSEVPNGWAENFLQVGMQINGNTTTDTTHGHGVDPVAVYLDEVRYEGFEL